MEILKKKGCSVLVVGLGFRTGLTSANFLASRGFNVTVSDNKTEEQLGAVTAKLNSDVKRLLGEQNPSLLDAGFDLIVLSPGVPAKIPLIAEANKRRIPVIAEVELAFHFMRGEWIAITGTDGKSTTTALTNYILKKVSYDSREGGNIGIPLISLVDSSTDDSVTVAELSSFQLETIDAFHPRIATLLNLAPDHLDRYDSMDHYLEAKLRIGMNMVNEDFIVYNLDDEVIAYSAQKITAQALSFSVMDPEADCYYDGTTIFLRLKERVVALDPSDLLILGIHNIKNLMATLLMIKSYCALLGVEPDFISLMAAAASFPGLKHRLEHVAVINNVKFINDSKATTVNSVKTALAACGANSVFIIGGRTKGEDYSILAEILRQGARHSILIGESSEQFEPLFAHNSYECADSMDEAVRKAFSAAVPGDCIVLSPGCASFDMYTDFEARGDDFKGCVAGLGEELSGS
ncbi:MAG: UDP-N-acetylmuramoyl-L-alanine--D-glutamate ligase [Spirochaetes bacterium]|jgi:UDP-N-acetylmuramoylalanine--D-glutamate ligase|nr:UDP-N-acetylmuramoyl-L-alanine--D-glutamate ligase [Spirochaetota bacterium]